MVKVTLVGAGVPAGDALKKPVEFREKPLLKAVEVNVHAPRQLVALAEDP